MGNNSRQDQLRAEYRSRINRVVDYIESHIDEELSLHGIADVACFSPFHFHRIFGAMMGETLNQFIQRLRIERAANQLVGNTEQVHHRCCLRLRILRLSYLCRSFRQYFGMSPSQWRGGGSVEYRKIRKTEGKARQAK